MAGAETYQTLVLIDDFNVTQPATGQLELRTNPDSFPADYIDAPGRAFSFRLRFLGRK